MTLLRRGRFERAGFDLYGAAVAAAREPFLYETLGVPDTLDGRFDLIGLHVFLVIRRVKREPAPGRALAQAVFDAMFADMDINLREMGVGDLSVGRKMKTMWEAFHGRSAAYAAAMAAADRPALEAALIRNVWRGLPPEHGDPAGLAGVALARAAALDTQSLADLARGIVRFAPSRDGGP
jgi:cytochrome b pre-mRNA-processing protein 3